MTATPIVENLANEFSVSPEHVRQAFEMIDAGLGAPFIGRFRRGDVGTMSESTLRRLQRRRQELEELDRRRGTILRMLEKEPGVTPPQLDEIRGCMDRFELEDLFVPHRRAEPEVQLALDRGLGALADLLVATLPRAERLALLGADAVDAEGKGGDPAGQAHGPEGAQHATEGGQRHADAAQQASDVPASEHAAEAHDSATAVADDMASHAEAHAEAEQHAAEGEAHAADAGDAHASEADEKEEAAAPAPTLDAPVVSHPQVDLRSAMNAQLARVCAEFVRPDKGIHTELEALSGALRILSDRLGRNAALRGQVRNMMRRQGVLTVRPAADEGRLARHRSLLKIKQPLRQIQGHRLLAIRQAQKERAVNTVITLDPKQALPKVRAALGRYTHPAYEDVLTDVALGALQYRLLPLVEQDVRLELKERGDQEALRFLSQHLRQILLAPPLPRQIVAGIDVSAKGDWTVSILDTGGVPVGVDARIEMGEKTPEQLGAELGALLAPGPCRFLAVGHGKAPRAAATKIRAALRAAKVEAWVMLVNDSGLSSYANSEFARAELPDRTVPIRMAISIGRRLQDPLEEFLKVDPRHLGLGVEQGLVSKANAKRVFTDTVESCTALVGCDVNYASELFLSRLPGLDAAAAKRLVARRTESPFTSREELRGEGLLTEAQWTNTAAFLRVYDGTEPLDCTNLHPEQYPLVRKLLESAGGSVEQMLGRPGSTKGLRRVDHQVDEYTWRDLMREIAFPGRDPRPRLHGPALLEADTDPIRLVKDRVVEGIVSNVTSFGAFVDIGLPADAMVHISEISDRYVRDARELLSIGQLVRARIVDSSGARLGLSLKNVPAPERPQFTGERPPRRRPRDGEGAEGARTDGGAGARPQGDRAPGADRGPRREGGGGRGGRGGPRRGRDEHDSRQPANVRAATTRRDGIGARSSGGFGRGGGGARGGGGGGGRPGGGARGGDFGGRGTRGDAEEGRLSDVAPTKKPAFNPFASFFKEKKDEPQQ